MTDLAISKTQLSLMVDIAQRMPLNVTPTKKPELDGLIADGLIEVKEDAQASSPYSVTEKGQQALADLGVGANES